LFPCFLRHHIRVFSMFRYDDDHVIFAFIHRVFAMNKCYFIHINDDSSYLWLPSLTFSPFSISSIGLAQILSFWRFDLRTFQTKNSSAGARCKKSSWIQFFNNVERLQSRPMPIVTDRTTCNVLFLSRQKHLFFACRSHWEWCFEYRKIIWGYGYIHSYNGGGVWKQ